jgi:hypothetical protein
VAESVEQARLAIVRTAPSAVFLDESAIGTEHGEEALESAASLLSETAPDVVAAAPEQQMDMAFLITCGVVDFVARASRYLPIVAGLPDRRVRIAERAAGVVQLSKDELVADFGEIPSARSEQPADGNSREHRNFCRPARPPATLGDRAPRDHRGARSAIARDRPRLSNAWEEHHEHARPGLTCGGRRQEAGGKG